MRVAPADVLVRRVARLRELLSERALDGLLVSSLANIAYLSGFFASAAALVVTREDAVLIGDSRYAEHLAARARECPFLRPIELPPAQSYDLAIVDVIVSRGVAAAGFEASHLTVSRHRYFTRALEQRGWLGALDPCDGLVESLRVCKDPWEVAILREGGARLSEVAKCILSNALAGRTEADVAADIESALRRAGFDRVAFDTIVASGSNAALPHARAGQRRIEAKDVVVLDFGGVLDGYCTDLTRTISAGAAASRERRLIEQVADAQAAAFRAVRAGAAPEAVDEAARSTLARYGLADAFAHGTGHGLGLEVHEAPRISRARPDHAEAPLAPGMVMTLEPGVYFPGWGGGRIEDDVLVTIDGAEWLTDVPKAL